MGYQNLIHKEQIEQVVTLFEAKNQLNVEDDYVDDDQLILRLIDDATALTLDFCGKDIALTENTLEYIDFTGSSYTVCEAPYKGELVITSTIDDVDTELVEGADYKVRTMLTKFVVIFTESVSCDKLTLTFNTGYTKDDIPGAIRAAILVKVNDLYDLERTSYTVGVNYRDTGAFERLLRAHTINRW